MREERPLELMALVYIGKIFKQDKQGRGEGVWGIFETIVDEELRKHQKSPRTDMEIRTTN